MSSADDVVELTNLPEDDLRSARAVYGRQTSWSPWCICLVSHGFCGTRMEVVNGMHAGQRVWSHVGRCGSTS